MDVSTDRRHPSHTYNDRSRFRQFGFTQQNVVVDTDAVETDMEISNGKRSLRHWWLGFSQCFSVISIFWCNSIIQQHKQTYLFLIYFSSPAIIQTPVWLGRSSKNLYMDEPESWNYFAIDSLNRLLLEQSVIGSLLFFIFFNDAVGWRQFYRHTMSNRTSLALQCG